MTLELKTAVVTGATSGIGRAIALELAHEGANVIVSGRDASRGAETVAVIPSHGGAARGGARNRRHVGSPDVGRRRLRARAAARRSPARRPIAEVLRTDDRALTEESSR
jgi:NAD(P)-dependent dehydrogenase (short-subunit alcohol dehydrogenase family)